MKKNQIPQLQESLRKAVESIESQSGVEVVVAVAPRLRKYPVSYFLWGVIVSFFCFTLVMFLPLVFHDEFIYLAALTGFALGYQLARVIPAMQKIVINEKISLIEAELHARASFQKSQMHQTRESIGVLFYFALFEQVVYILPDTGALELVPPTEWDKIHQWCQDAVKTTDASHTIIEALNKTAPIFKQYIILRDDDINELSDHPQMM